MMKIAILAPIAWRTPPRHYGPWEWVASLLTEGLVKRGVEATLFATGDSQTAAELVWTAPRPYEEDKTLDPKVWECLHISRVFEEAERFDLIHNHFDFLPLTYSALVRTPVVTTIHGFSSPKILPVYQKLTTAAPITSPLARRIAIPAWITSPPFITGSPWKITPSRRPRETTSFSWGGSTGTRGPMRPSSWPAPRGCPC